MNIITLSEEAYYALLEETIQYIRKQIKDLDKSDEYVTKEVAKSLLHVRSDTTLARLKNEQKIVVSYISARKQLYSLKSIKEYLKKQAV